MVRCQLYYSKEIREGSESRRCERQGRPGRSASVAQSPQPAPAPSHAAPLMFIRRIIPHTTCVPDAPPRRSGHDKTSSKLPSAASAAGCQQVLHSLRALPKPPKHPGHPPFPPPQPANFDALPQRAGRIAQPSIDTRQFRPLAARHRDRLHSSRPRFALLHVSRNGPAIPARVCVGDAGLRTLEPFRPCRST